MVIGYLHHKEETKQITLYKDGVKYYHTGDKGYINESGCVFIIDC